MAKIRKRNLLAIQRWMDSKPGQMLLNYAYSWGASVVILGALFKLTHISGADLMLFLGMGTEVIVFFLSGFERPWDKDEDDDVKVPATGGVAIEGGGHGPVIIGGGVPHSGPIIIGGGAPVAASGGAPVAAGGGIAEGVQTTGVAGVDPSVLASQIASTPVIPGQPFNGMSPEMEEATRAYVEQLNELTETLKQVAEQSARLTRDSEEMETMNRTLTGINRFYEMQLRSVSNQSNTVDEVHEQTKRLAEQLDELNGVYARMVEALKVNMK